MSVFLCSLHCLPASRVSAGRGERALPCPGSHRERPSSECTAPQASSHMPLYLSFYQPQGTQQCKVGIRGFISYFLWTHCPENSAQLVLAILKVAYGPLRSQHSLLIGILRGCIRWHFVIRATCSGLDWLSGPILDVTQSLTTLIFSVPVQYASWVNNNPGSASWTNGQTW